MTSGCCCCCVALRPRYKQLVDNIFPECPVDGLIKANMEKLTFYALSAPEKLDRIGAYLAERLSYDVARNTRHGFVFIAMEALDRLLLACHSQSINLFVESFLRMVAKLLECSEPQLQVLGTNSFVKFANIEEDTPSYHRSYDFFVCKFSSMSHQVYDDPETCTSVRIAGIKGLQGILRKTVQDELQGNIWEVQYMDKIVPSLLFNMQQADEAESRSPSPLQLPERAENPACLAENCLRELLSRSAYGTIHSVVQPILTHLDNHKLWVPNTFAVRCFKIVMYSIPPQHYHLVIQQLLSHLDLHGREVASVRAGVVQAFTEAVIIAASGSIGPTVLEVFNTLLHHLRLSVDYQLQTSGPDPRSSLAAHSVQQEQMFQESLVTTIGSFADILPDYQRSEIMRFIMSKMPLPGSRLAPDMPRNESTDLTQTLLLRSLLRVASGYHCGHLAGALSGSFLDALLSGALAFEPQHRLLVMKILQVLLDRHGNRESLENISVLPDITTLNLKKEKCSRQDLLFMKKYGQQLLRHVYLNSQCEENGSDMFRALYCSLGLLGLEFAGEDIALDLFRVALAMQDVALDGDEPLSVFSRCALLALTLAFVGLLGRFTAVPALCQHVAQVVEARQEKAPHLLPENLFREPPSLPRNMSCLDKSLLLLNSKVSEALGGCGYAVERLSVPYQPQLTDEDCLSKRRSTVETISIQVEVESRSPEHGQKTPAEQITFETLKKAVVDSTSRDEQEKEHRRQVLEHFRKAPFEDIASQCEARANLLQNKLNQIFDMTIRPPPSPSGSVGTSNGQRSIPVYEMNLPDLCVY
uniref:EFR3 homolog B n=1 Tax=Eptatretus burgeri TaxID=7764 RepID=A0A8C4Q735_EPTBU